MAYWVYTVEGGIRFGAEIWRKFVVVYWILPVSGKGGGWGD
jgi:hypothetical protein